MSRIKKQPTKQFSVNFPVSLTEEIDTICSATFTTRTSWIMKAAQEKLDNDRAEREKRIKEKFN